VINEGHYPTPIMLLYHLNFGFPFVDEGSKLAVTLKEPVKLMAGRKTGTEISFDTFTAPEKAADLQVFSLQPRVDKNGTASIAIIQSNLGKSGMGVYLRYKPEQFPKLFETRMLGEGHYFVSLEPGTNDFGRKELHRKSEINVLQPGENRVFDLEIGVLDGEQEIKSFQNSLKS
jgi:hypothetical protein